MTETITSKYTLFYWIKIPALIVLIALFAGVYINTALKDNSSEYLTNRLYAGLLVAVLIIYFIFIWFSSPVRVTVDTGAIMFYYYISRKEVIINYTDIDKIRTVRVNSNIRGGTQVSYQRMEIVLINNDTYYFDENEYTNYDALKSAIYDNMWRRDNT